MPLERTWTRPTRRMLTSLLAASGMAAGALFLFLQPAAWQDLASPLAIGLWSVGLGLFVGAWIPFVLFLHTARIAMTGRTVVEIEGYMAVGAARPEPPFTPSAPRRFFGWGMSTGSLPSCLIWVYERRKGPMIAIRIVLASTAMEGDPMLENAKHRLKRWLERHPRRSGKV